MEIYFVRHGQTGGNEARRHQQETTALTTLGKAQAAQVAVRVATLKPTHLLVSDRVRAIETGIAIAAVTDLIPETNSLVCELHRPSGVYGYKHNSARSIWYLLRWFFGLEGSADVDSAAGESYAYLRKRIADTQAHLAGLPTDARVVVVSHAVYISMFLVHMNRPRALSFWGAIQCFRKLRTLKNASVTTVHYDAHRGWKLVSWNDYSHFD